MTSTVPKTPEGEPRLRTSPSQSLPGRETPFPSLQQRTMSSGDPALKPQQKVPPQGSSKRKGLYNDIDPDLFAFADVNEGNGVKKKPKKWPIAKENLVTSQGADGIIDEYEIASGLRKTGKRLPAPISFQKQDPSNFPTPTPQTQFRKRRGFAIDLDLLATTTPVGVKKEPQRSTAGWRMPMSQAMRAQDPSSEVRWLKGSLQTTPQRIMRDGSRLSEDVVPETSPPPSAKSPHHILSLLGEDSQISIIDAIDDYASPRKSKPHSVRTGGPDASYSDIDITSSPPLCPSSRQSSISKQTDDPSISGDSVPDPDFTTSDMDLGTPLPMHRRLLKELKQQPPMTPTPQTSRPGYLNIHELQKSIVVPKTAPSRHSHSEFRYFSPGGLADTVAVWRGGLHDTSIFKQRIQPTSIEYVITVAEMVQDGDMVLIRGHGEGGVVKAIISGPAITESQISAGQVVKYWRPWVVVNVLGEEGWRCLMGKIEVQGRGGDLDMVG